MLFLATCPEFRAQAWQISESHALWLHCTELKGLEPPPLGHAPCAMSSSRMKRFNDRTQPSMSMFMRKPASAPTEHPEADANLRCALLSVERRPSYEQGCFLNVLYILPYMTLRPCYITDVACISISIATAPYPA